MLCPDSIGSFGPFASFLGAMVDGRSGKCQWRTSTQKGTLRSFDPLVYAMSFFRRHWYDVGAVVAAVATISLIAGWQDMSVLRRLLALNFIALLIHQYEEYGWPGGDRPS